MSREQAMQLYAAGGFPISADGKNPTNRCGKPAKPRITFVDMNGDGRKEALFIDSGACYRVDGRWFAVATQDGGGQWRQVLAGEGSTATTGTEYNGWFVLTATSGGKTQRLRFNGSVYVPVDQAAAPPAAPPTARPAVQSLSTEPLLVWDNEQLPEAKALSAPEQAAIFRATGAKRLAGGTWTNCAEDPSGNSVSQIVLARDLNGDGKREAMTHNGGTYCNGFAGMSSIVLSETAPGSWAVLHQSQGFINFMKSRGMGNYPDIQIGLPGFCFPYLRFDGTTYQPLANLDDKGKPCRPG